MAEEDFYIGRRKQRYAQVLGYPLRHDLMIKFGTDGWRAIMCDDFTFSNVNIVVQAIADYVKAHKGEDKGLIIGYDARFLSEKFAEEAGKVLATNGIAAYIIERDAPTPVVAHAIVQLNTAGAIMFTASHNPPEYNGIKYIPDYAGPADPEITTEIEVNIAKILEKGTLKYLSLDEAEGFIKYIDPSTDYIKHLKTLIDLKKIKDSGLRIVYDPMYSSGRGYLDRILIEAGITPVVLNNNRDPLFGGSSPEPSEERLQKMRDLIIKREADLGLATDGDADRFGIIDDTGRYITPNKVISLLLTHLVEKKGLKGPVGRSVATTHMIDRLAERYGLDVYETPVGFKYIGKLMRENDIIIGGEESGGLSIRGHIPEKDGILACLLAAEMRASSGKPLSGVLEDLMKDIGGFFTRRLDIRYPQDKKERLMNNLKETPPKSIGGKAVKKVTTIDGVKFLLEDESWFLVRPSGTEPLIRVYMESSTAKDLDNLESTLQTLI